MARYISDGLRAVLGADHLRPCKTIEALPIVDFLGFYYITITLQFYCFAPRIRHGNRCFEPGGFGGAVRLPVHTRSVFCRSVCSCLILPTQAQRIRASALESLSRGCSRFESVRCAKPGLSSPFLGLSRRPAPSLVEAGSGWGFVGSGLIFAPELSLGPSFGFFGALWIRKCDKGGNCHAGSREKPTFN